MRFYDPELNQTNLTWVKGTFDALDLYSINDITDISKGLAAFQDRLWNAGQLNRDFNRIWIKRRVPKGYKHPFIPISRVIFGLDMCIRKVGEQVVGKHFKTLKPEEWIDIRTCPAAIEVSPTAFPTDGSHPQNILIAQQVNTALNMVNQMLEARAYGVYVVAPDLFQALLHTEPVMQPHEIRPGSKEGLAPYHEAGLPSSGCLFLFPQSLCRPGLLDSPFLMDHLFITPMRETEMEIETKKKETFHYIEGGYFGPYGVCMTLDLSHSEESDLHEDIPTRDSMRHALRMGRNLLSYLKVYPNDKEEISTKISSTLPISQLEKRDKQPSPGHPITVVGREFKLQREESQGERKGHGGSHASPTIHWRRGHFRNQVCGKGNQDRKMIWLQPTLVGAGKE